jgi:hypothetical protein
LSEIVWHFITGVMLSVATFVAGRGIIGFCHKHGWYPEKRLTLLLTGWSAAVQTTLILSRKPPHLEIPGLVWVRLKRGWQAEWRTDARDFKPRRQLLWKGITPCPEERIFIAEQSIRLQNELYQWQRGGVDYLSRAHDAA